MLDTWPAHSTSQRASTSVFLTKNKQLVVLDEAARGRASSVPKPKFLDQLETFLKKELKAMAADTVEPSEVRLQVFISSSIITDHCIQIIQHQICY